MLGPTHSERALTPDFYHYPWARLASVAVDGHFLVLRWPDGVSLRAFDRWLRENAVGPGGVDPATREVGVDPAHIPAETAAAAVAITAAGALRVSWQPDDLDALYHPGWLRHVAEGRHMVDAWLPEPIAWRAADLAEPPTIDGRSVLTDGTVLEEWVAALCSHGIARLRDTPLDPELCGQLATRIGAIRDSNFGPIWDVKAELDPGSLANTTTRLCPHTDLPTRETPPGFQFLHCLVNTAAGGYSTMADGLAVVDHLQRNHPDHYEALTTLKWIFFNRGRQMDHRWSGPIIDLGAGGGPMTLRAFHPVRAFPDMAEADVPRAYDALRAFSEAAADPQFQLRYPFRPGDVVGFDNRRILHGRDGYESSGARHLRGAYMDRDEVLSFARVSARRRWEAATAAAGDPERTAGPPRQGVHEGAAT